MKRLLLDKRGRPRLRDGRGRFRKRTVAEFMALWGEEFERMAHERAAFFPTIRT